MRTSSLRPASFALDSLLVGAVVAIAFGVGGCSSAESMPGESIDSGTPGDALGDTDDQSDAPVSTPFPATTTKLTGDDEVLGAGHADPNLLNAWGLAFGPTGIAWISGNRSDKALLYDALGAPQPLIVTVPPSAAGGAARPTGQVYNGVGNDFLGDKFVIAGEDGAIAGWSAGDLATIRVDNSSTGARYTGLALVAPVAASLTPLSSASSNTLVAADFHNAKVDVFDATYEPIVVAGAFVDPTIPAGYAPFGVAQLGGEVFVTYAKQDAKGAHAENAPGNGFVSVFDLAGGFRRRFASHGALVSPWGLAQVPDGFGALSGAILIGNSGDGVILVYDASGARRGLFTDASGNRLFIDGLWSLVFFAPAGEAPSLFYTAGPGAQAHGVFGRLDLAAQQ